MEYSISKSTEVLARTPQVLRALLTGVSDEWLLSNEGPDTFSPFEVIGHLIYGEKTDWTARIKLILASGDKQPFEKYDRFAMFEESKGKSITDLLEEFETIRAANLAWLRSLELQPADLLKQGLHPVLGNVTLKNLLATWAVHDLTHIAQISRVMAKQYKTEIGPWTEFFRILNF